MIKTLSPSTSGTPFSSQVTDGVGTPLTGHLMVMVVFEAAVTLSPMFIVTGLPLPIGISRPDSGTLIDGLTGSMIKGITQKYGPTYSNTTVRKSKTDDTGKNALNRYIKTEIKEQIESIKYNCYVGFSRPHSK